MRPSAPTASLAALRRNKPGRNKPGRNEPGRDKTGRSVLPFALAGVLALLAALGLVSCASTSDVKKVEETNQVQDRRLTALERDVGKVLAEQRALMATLQADVQGAKGRTELMVERTERMANEQKAITEGLERALAEQRKLSRTVDEELARMKRSKLESDSELDKMRLQLAELEKLLRSPLSRLPAKTEADLDFRAAHYHLISGEFDIAADKFEQFRKEHPKDPRGIDALYRRGQAFFLLRRYDHALIPLFELVDKAPKHELATPARWYLARALEETGDLKLAREFYAQLINEKTAYANDATRRVAFINRLFPRSQGGQGQQ